MAKAQRALARRWILPPFIRALLRSLRLENKALRAEDVEPFLRRSVPFMIAVFLITLAGTHATERLFHRDASITDTRLDILNLAEGIAHGLSPAVEAPDDLPEPAELERALPTAALEEGRNVFIVGTDGDIELAAGTNAVETAPMITEGVRRSLAQGPNSGVVEVLQEDGEIYMIATAPLPGEHQRVAVVQTRSDALAAWMQTLPLNIFLYVSTAFVILLLGSAFYWQAERARDAQASFFKAHLRLNKALTHGRAGLWDWNIEAAQIEWSQSMFDILGLDHPGHALSVGAVMRMMHPEDRDLFTIADSLLESPQSITDRTFRMRHADGSWRWLQARAEVVRVRGEGHRLIGVAFDITDERAAAERTVRDDRRVREAIESISKSFVLWDADQKLVLCNSKYRELNGLHADVVVPGRTRREIEAARHNPLLDLSGGEGVERSFLDDCARSFEARSSDGRWFQCSERRTHDGGTVSFATDITALKQHERRLTESQSQLRATITDLERSRAQLERQTQELRELARNYATERNRAEEALRVKTSFLMSMSHELRTPLNAIIGFSQMLEGGMLGPIAPRYADYASDIRGSGEYLLQLISDVLDMSRIEAGRYVLETEDVDLAQLVSDSMKMLSIQADQKALAVSSRVSPSIRLEGDCRALKQILLNVLSNAVKFTPEGGRIEVRARRVGEAVTLTIEDTGIGMPREFLKKIGKPFEQVQNQLTRDHSGSGLGLAITKKLVEMHDGAMKIRSRLDHGTIISIRLPLKQNLKAGRPAITLHASAKTVAAGPISLNP